METEKKLLLFAILLVLLIPVAASEELPSNDMVFSEVRQLVSTFPLTAYAGGGSQMCILIRTGDREFLSYSLFKEGERVEVAPSPESVYCENDLNNNGPEDFVIQYVSYDAFKRHVKSPTCDNFKTGGAGRDFYYLPSEFIKPGGDPVCNDVFENRYCGAVRQCASELEMRAGGLDCCVERGPLLGNRAFLLFVALALLLSFLMTAWIIIKKGRQDSARESMSHHAEKLSELHDFIEEEIQEGYSTMDIREHLEKIGWDDDVIDKAMESYEKQDW